MITNFQRSSAQAVIAHLNTHSFALCADEPGMGKTYLARAVIEQMALERLRGQKIDFTPLAQALGSGKRQKEMAGSMAALGKKLGIALPEHRAKERWNSYFITCLEQLAASPAGTASLELWAGLAEMMGGVNTNGRHMSAWRLSWPQAPRLRVLYVCCNLAIAEQNKERISPVPQIFQECDRLSMLWEAERLHATPFVDLYAITATLSKRETSGTRQERSCLARYCRKVCQRGCLDRNPARCNPENALRLNDNLLHCARTHAEAYSMQGFAPDLVIFDEFQNFGDMIKLIAGGVSAQKDDEALQRLRTVCSHLYGGDRTPKTLLLSATPFHPQEVLHPNRISFAELLDFLSLDRTAPPSLGQWEAMTEHQREAYLYQHGVFRNRREELIKWEGQPFSPVSTRVMLCPPGDLLQTAWLLGSQDAQERQISPAILLDTPLPERYCDAAHYKGASRSWKNIPPRDPMGHGKYRAVRHLALGGTVEKTSPTAPQPDDSWGGRTPQERPPVWLPPVDGGGGSRYSKLLIYTDYWGTQAALAALLRLEVPSVQSADLAPQWRELLLSPGRWREECLLTSQAPTVCLLRHFFPERYQAVVHGELEALASEENQAMAQFLDFLLACGLPPVREEMLAYCRRWRLDQTLAEYAAVCRIQSQRLSPWQQLERVLKYGEERNGRERTWTSFAMELTPVELAEADKGPTLRGAFNSPFWPHVLVSTSIGAEGLDFHLYCRRVLHYALPKNCIALEQRNGRVNRRDCLATRMAWAEGRGEAPDWKAFSRQEPSPDSSGILPHWYTRGDDLEEIFLCYPPGISSDLEELQALLDQRTAYQAHLDFSLSPFCRER